VVVEGSDFESLVRVRWWVQAAGIIDEVWVRSGYSARRPRGLKNNGR
jgi:hypothetical protein